MIFVIEYVTINQEVWRGGIGGIEFIGVIKICLLQILRLKIWNIKL